MEKCRIHSVLGKVVSGFITDHHVHTDSEGYLFYDFLDPYLLPVESGDKWGLMDGNTYDIVVPLQFEYTGLFVNGASHAVKNGLHGYIGARGEIVLPFEYENACEEPSSDGHFAVKQEKWGVVNRSGETVVPFLYDSIFLQRYFDKGVGWFQPYAGLSAIREVRLVLFDSDYRVLVDNLTEYPRRYGDYLLLKSGRKFGVACLDGRLITDVTLLKREAMNLIKKLGGGF